MSYVAIARKYRPFTFDEIVGQDHVTRTLRNAITSGRIHHAFLFCGARGVGKTTAARVLARALNCVRGPTPEPCGECASCREVLLGSSPDLIEIDGASNNSVDDIRELRETVHYAPTRGAYKIYLIDEVHMLSKPAFNALLKTLEEPPPHVVFIFATTEPNKILDTILSRVQRFDFKRIGLQSVVARLREIADAEGAVVSDNGLRLIARAGEGSMRDAQSLLDKVISFGGATAITDAQVAEMLGLVDRRLLYAMLEGIVSGRPELCLEVIAEVYDYGFELAQFTTELLEVLRNATFVRLSPAARKHVDISGDELERLDQLVADVPSELLTRVFDALLEVHDAVSRAARPRPVLEIAVARLATRRPVQPIAELLGRLESLERRLRQQGGAPPQPRGPRPALTRDPAPPERPPEPPPASPQPRSRARAPAPRPSGAPTPSEDEPRPPPVRRPPREEPPPPEPPGPPDPPPRANTAPQRGWSVFQAALGALGGAASHLAAGAHEQEGDRLVVRVQAGRELAEARRAARTDEVRAALDRAFGAHVRIEVFAAEGTGTERDQEQALQRELTEDPAFKRILAGLDGRLEKVVSLRDQGQ